MKHLTNLPPPLFFVSFPATLFARIRFNMIFLPLVSVVNVLHLLDPTDEWRYWLMFQAFLGYIVLDSFIVFLKPNCVGSPKTIQIHHIVTTGGWCMQLFDQELRKPSALALLVEINTWFKISKRYLHDSMLIDAFFYLTWFVLRVMLYPYLVIQTGRYFVSSVYTSGVSSSGLPLINFSICLLLTGMNLKWTWDLVAKGSYLGMRVIKTNGYISSMEEAQVDRGRGAGGNAQDGKEELQSDLSKLTMAELKAILADKGVAVRGKTKKARLIELVEGTMDDSKSAIRHDFL
jgi:hypothetical protein